MSVFVVGDQPEVAALLERRHALGQDVRDEVWQGVHHMSPFAEAAHGAVEMSLGLVLHPLAAAAGLGVTGPFNMGDSQDFRIPDLAVRDPNARGVYLSSAPIVGEVLSPGDETYAKFEFYFAHGVLELIVADPETRVVQIWVRGKGSFRPASASAILHVTSADLELQIAWPPGPASEPQL